MTGLDGAGKSTLVDSLAARSGARRFRLPYNDFVRSALARSGNGSPFGDVHTDRLLFALDARLANYAIREWRQSGLELVSQRGWMDNFIFGAVQGVSYEKTEAMLRSFELERATAHIYLVADPDIALARLAAAEHRDKFETAEFIASQHGETLRFYQAARASLLPAFAAVPSILIDTSAMTEDQVCAEACEFLRAVEAKPAAGA